ncbi:Transcription regulatory protein SNF6 [Nakaseomyces bracarensis]|uniref:Transcription regulatory protein SNF6 n=1 Tax=Nakaseomyces bracarensis TaxID=273131 RepID=A0ABR4NTC3_9SACH
MAVVKKRSYKKSVRPKNGRVSSRTQRVPEYLGINGGSLLPGSLQLFDVDEESRMLVLADNVGAVQFEKDRLKAESMNSITHDESDTISFRNYLLANYLRSANYFNALTLHNVPISRIKPPKLFQAPVSALDLKKSIELQKASMGKINAVKDSWEREKDAMVGSEHSKFYKSKAKLLESDTPDSINQLIKSLETRLGCRLQDRPHHIYNSDIFAPKFRGDLREAPEDYWDKYSDIVKERKEREVMLQKQKEEEEARQKLEEEQKKQEEEDERRRREEEAKKPTSDSASMTPSNSSIPLQMSMAMHGPDSQTSSQASSMPAPVMPPGMVTANANVSVTSANSSSNPLGLDQSQPPPLPGPQQPLMAVGSEQPNQDIENVFEDYGSEPFNTGFDDEFADLDNVFF